MKTYDRLKKDMLSRSINFIQEHPITPPIARATALVTEAGVVEASMEAQHGSQVLGSGGFRGGAAERGVLADDLYTAILDMANTAKGLDRAYPGMKDQFRLGRARSSQSQLLATANAFLTAASVPAVKQLFVDRAFAADFDVQLTAKIAALTAAVNRKVGGLQTQQVGTATLANLGRQATQLMRELRPLVERHLRQSDPSLVAVWKLVSRTHRRPTRKEETDGGSSSGSGSGSTGTGSESTSRALMMIGAGN